ncbi:hypothetical protein TRAPUB_2105 [Trametes pubescens]|uniref:Uncharacterized protein n=1 Tax=Trametes pubescens TaxID=154538 RepID=A0A1M2VHS4_TRAPU|nr:hypothetical protein TRAPUB_2105 [Trametes pubescens]
MKTDRRSHKAPLLRASGRSPSKPRPLPAGGKIDGPIPSRCHCQPLLLTQLEGSRDASELGPCPATRSQQRSNDVATRAAGCERARPLPPPARSSSLLGDSGFGFCLRTVHVRPARED